MERRSSILLGTLSSRCQSRGRRPRQQARDHVSALPDRLRVREHLQESQDIKLQGTTETQKGRSCAP